MALSFRFPAAVIAGVVVIVLGVAAALWWLFSDSREVLFDHLDAAQLNGISTELDRSGIAYKIDREKAAILVAGGDARRARLAVMASGNALRDNTGFELFDKSDFGMTDFAQKINYQRAIEGEIARTVSALAGIKYTRVHLVLPEHSLFQTDRQKPRASVTVFLNGGAGLSEERVRGIQRITASAVPELAEQDVVVVNQEGTTLSGPASDDAPGALSSARLAQKQALESYLQEKVRRVLLPAVGAGHFAVSVDVSLDLNQKTTTKETVLEAPANTGVKHLKESSNRSKGENGNDDLLREVEYAVGHESEQIVHKGGEIRRLQVGVIIDSDVKGLDLDKLHELVATAVGIDAHRGDKVAVVENHRVIQKVISELEAGPAPAEPAPPTPARRWSSPLLFGIGLLVGGGIVALVLRQLARRREQLRVQHLRRELQHWLVAEPLRAELP